jgi:predicted 2-oxoglutarate/Fe(II)-dependent dioxygenase YbiX
MLVPAAEFFAHLGFFVCKDFLPADLRLQLLSEMRAGLSHNAGIARASTVVVDQAVRRTRRVDVIGSAADTIESRLEAMKGTLEKHFTELQSPQYLIYRRGDRFTRHHDTAGGDFLDYVRDRKISVVLFLNSQSDRLQRNTFGGGNLVFYGLIGDSRLSSYGYPLSAEAGTLVAFSSKILHEVTPVTRGVRYSVVSWYC